MPPAIDDGDAETIILISVQQELSRHFSSHILHLLQTCSFKKSTGNPREVIDWPNWPSIFQITAHDLSFVTQEKAMDGNMDCSGGLTIVGRNLSTKVKDTWRFGA